MLRRLGTAALGAGVGAAALSTLKPSYIALAEPSQEPSGVTLRYWKCQGRGQILRYMLYDSGIPFTDEIVPLSKEGVQVLPPGAMGVCRFLPVYEGPDGSGSTFQLIQSKAIIHHVAKTCGYLPTTTSECARASEVFYTASEDVVALVLQGLWGGSDALAAAIPKVRMRLAELEVLSARRGELTCGPCTERVVVRGTERSIRPVDFSDFAVLFAVDLIEQLFTPASSALVLLEMPTIRCNVALLRQRPGVKQALEQRAERITGSPGEPETRAAFQAKEANMLAP